MHEFRLKLHWSLFVRIQLIIYQHWFWSWLGAYQATSHYLDRWWLDNWRIYASLGLNELEFVFVYLHIPLSHCYHCADLAESNDKKKTNCLSLVFCRVLVEVLIISFNYLSCNIWSCLFSAYPFLLWWLWEYVYSILLWSSYRKYKS